MKRLFDRAWPWLLIIVALGVVLRLWGLASKGVWYDEACSIAMAKNDLTWSNFFSVLAYKPVYFFFLRIWTQLFGVSEFWVRFPSALFGIGTIFPVYFLGKEIFGKKEGLTAAFLLAISCFHIYHSQQVRHFTLMVLLISFSFLSFVYATKSHRALSRYLNTGINICLIFLHPYAMAIILVQYIFVEAYERSDLIAEWRGCQALVLFSWLSWFLMANKAQMIRNLWWIREPEGTSLWETIQTFSYGGPRYGLDDYHLAFQYPWALAFLLAVYIGCFLAGACGFYVHAEEQKKRYGGLLLLWFLLPIGMTMFLSFWFPIYAIKHSMIALPAFYLIVAAGLFSVRSYFVRFLLILIIFVINLHPLATLYACDLNIQWRDGAGFLRKNIQSKDVVILSTSSELAPFLFYFSDRPETALRNFDPNRYCRVLDDRCEDVFSENENLIVAVPQDQGEGSEVIFGNFLRKFNDLDKSHPKVIWFLTSRWTGEKEKKSMLGRLAKSYRLKQQTHVRGVDIFKFEK
jgi:4-amino-4-deoxy-L-arabinose transferase-like glycosyltransferase